MKRHWKPFFYLSCVFEFLYFALFIFSFSELFYYDEHYSPDNPGTGYLAWPSIGFSLKLAVIFEKIIGFPFGFYLFFINALVASLVILGLAKFSQRLRKS